MSLLLDMLIRWVDETAGLQNEDDSEPQAEEDLESQDEEGLKSQDEEGSKPRVDRVLWIDPSGTDVVTIDIFDERALPMMQQGQVILSAIRDNDALVLKSDPYASLLLPEQDIPLKYREHRDRAWNTIAPLVENPEILVPSKRGPLVREASERTGHTKATLYKWLRRYWQRGPFKKENSVLPDFKRCGAPGVDRPAEDALASAKRGRRSDLALDTGEQKGINVTKIYRQRILRGIKKFYKPGKVSMKEARQKTLEEYFRIGFKKEGDLLIPDLPPDDEVPSLGQFWYYYRKYRDPVRLLKLLYGASRYASDFRPVLSHSRDMSFGPGSLLQLDFAIAKIELVSSTDRSKRIGMPLVGLAVDVFSGVIAGLSITPEHESGLALVLLLENTFLDKEPLSLIYGIPFTEFEWPYKGVAEKALLDRGPGEGPIATDWADDLNFDVQNTQARRPDLKGLVERHFRDFREEAYIDLPGAYPRHKRRGGPDPRVKACLTIYEFTQIMILRVLEYNSLTLMQDYPMDPDMIADGILPRPLELWHWGIQHRSGHLRFMSPDTLRVNLLPKEMASLSRTGLHFRNLDYVWPFNEKAIVEAGVEGAKKFSVAYDPRLVNAIYLHLNDRQPLARCELRAKHHAFLGWTWNEVEEYQRFLKVAEQADGTRKNEVRARRNAYKKRIVTNAQDKAESAKEGKSRAALLRGVKENRAKERTLERKRSVGTWDGDVESSGVPGLVTEPEYDGDESIDERVPWPQDVSALRKLRERGPEND